MEDTNTENLDSQMEEQEITNSTNGEAPEQQEGETKDEFTEREKQYYARIKKLETELKEAKSQKAEAPKAQNDDLSQADLIFLAKADIHEDDINDVTKWAKNNGMSVKEAYQQYKPILDTRVQERQTAQATATKGARGVKPKTGEDLLQKARQTGEVPESSDGMRDIIRARLEERRKGQRR